MRIGACGLVVSVWLCSSAARAQPLVPPPGAGDLRVTLQASYVRGTTHAEQFAGVLVSVPLARFASPLPLGQSIAPSPAVPPNAEGHARAAPSSTAVYRPRLHPALVRRVVKAALRAAGMASRARALDELAARSRASALLPQLQLRGARGIDYSRRLAPTSDDPNRYSEQGAADLLLEVRLDFRLNRLLFASEEIAIERLRSERANARSRLVARVLAVLMQWERARAKAADPTLAASVRAKAELDRLEAELWLDVLTAGAFQPLIVGS